jgi:hypothetical protein
MDWKTLLAHITGSVDQELLLRNEYLVTENRILRDQIKGSCTFSLWIIQLPENQVASLRFADLRGGTRDGTRPAVLHALAAWNPGALYEPALGLATAARGDQPRHHTGDEAFTSA